MIASKIMDSTLRDANFQTTGIHWDSRGGINDVSPRKEYYVTPPIPFRISEF
jgi:hypothetical protein